MRLKQKLVGLTPSQDRKLKRKAKALKISVSQLVRNLIDMGLPLIITDQDFA